MKLSGTARFYQAKQCQACFYHNSVFISKTEQLDSFLLVWVVSEWSSSLVKTQFYLGQLLRKAVKRRSD